MPPKKKDTSPPPNPHLTRQQVTLQASGEATSAPPSSLATPAPGAGAPSSRKLKAVDKPVAAASGSGSNPPAKDKAKAVDKPAAGGRNPTAGAAKEKKKPGAATGGKAAATAAGATGKAGASTGVPEDPTVPRPSSVSSLPDLWGVTDSSVSDEETTTAPLHPPQSEPVDKPAWFAAFPINRQTFAAEAHAVNQGASATPSLASLLNPASSAPGKPLVSPPRSERSTSSAHPRGRGVLSAESVSHHFQSKPEDLRVFVTLCRDIEIFDEEVGVSLLKYHPVYDPNCDRDPLTSYGAVDGLLPGKTAEETIAFRDVVMCWELPHINLYWETLEEGIASFGEQKPAYEHLLVYQSDQGLVYSLGSFCLEQFAQLVLVVKQVLDVEFRRQINK
ncbi:hypothetical protein B0H13DRAFT_2337526 [Mycena leptocephala]|nr:hypothetical protein B0H13DRAFT_2337526 [Mycena leptocephala]